MGDHGGHQKAIQRIPIVFDWPGLRSGASPLDSDPVASISFRRSCELMGIAEDPAYPTDGNAVSLPLAP